MSSFMISTDCMNNIINGLFWNNEFKDLHKYLFKDQQLHESNDFLKLSEKLFLLNQKAVFSRYNDKPNSDYAQIPKFKWKDKSVSDMQFLKSMECLRYQCYEGNIPKTKLFKWLDRVIAAFQNHVIYKIPEYTKAKWD